MNFYTTINNRYKSDKTPTNILLILKLHVLYKIILTTCKKKKLYGLCGPGQADPEIRFWGLRLIGSLLFIGVYNTWITQTKTPESMDLKTL